jgi:hypothetical protein
MWGGLLPRGQLATRLPTGAQDIILPHLLRAAPLYLRTSTTLGRVSPAALVAARLYHRQPGEILSHFTLEERSCIRDK